VHDIVNLESRGLPGVFTASDVFVEAAAAQSRALGLSPEVVFVAHPIQDRTDDEIRALADAAIDRLVERITTSRASRPIRGPNGSA
jgi:alkanesulfonate monooxygenase SsuD/methylene tetrahydromethanopterin reductase-like flavin-dependent oxidoreductase (luciferase family)